MWASIFTHDDTASNVVVDESQIERSVEEIGDVSSHSAISWV